MGWCLAVALGGAWVAVVPARRPMRERGGTSRRVLADTRPATSSCGAQEASPPTSAPARPSPARHLARRVDVSLVLEQQPHHGLMAVLGSHDEARPPVLRGAEGDEAAGSAEDSDWGWHVGARVRPESTGRARLA